MTAFPTLLHALSVIAFACAGCGGGKAAMKDAGNTDAGTCPTKVSLDCQVAFMPTYSEIYSNLLLKTCGAPSTGTSCHGPDGAQDGLVLSDKQKAYDFLMGKTDPIPPLVVPGRPDCSILVQRLESDDPNFRMPLGQTKLSEGVRCAVRKWIKAGAAMQ